VSGMLANTVTLPLDGPATIRTIGAVRTALQEALARHHHIQLDVAAADPVDLSFVQLLLAARRSAREAGKQLTLAAPAGGALLCALEQGGFLPPGGADPFWSCAA
jgi:ABC-type transporter Mla MlaB component